MAPPAGGLAGRQALAVLLLLVCTGRGHRERVKGRRRKLSVSVNVPFGHMQRPTLHSAEEWQLPSQAQESSAWPPALPPVLAAATMLV